MTDRVLDDHMKGTRVPDVLAIKPKSDAVPAPYQKLAPIRTAYTQSEERQEPFCDRYGWIG